MTTIYKTYEYAIPTNSSVRIFSDATYFRILDATYPTIADLQISFNNEPNSDTFQGFALNISPFRGQSGFVQIDVYNLNANTNTVILGVSDSEILDNRFSINGTISSNISDAITSAADVTCANGAATSVIAQNLNRIRAYIFNPAALGTTPIRVGDSNVTATRGLPVPPQQAVSIATTAALYVYNNTGASIDVPYSEEA